MTTKVYELTGVSLRLGRKMALEDLTLTLEGRCTGLLGPNGAGKTSLLRLLATVYRPTRGRVLFRGRDVVREPAHARSRIGYVPQHFRPPGDLTGRQILAYLGALRQVPRVEEAAQRALEETGLERVAHQPVSTYSGGMLRRLALAQALLTEPEFLLMDEPTAGLDPEERDRFRTLIRSLTAAGRQALISTHLLEDVSVLADSVAVLHDGRVRFSGTPEQLIDAMGAADLEEAYLHLLRSGAAAAGEVAGA